MYHFCILNHKMKWYLQSIEPQIFTLAISRSTNLTSDLPLTYSPVWGKVSDETKSEKGRRNSGTE